MKSEITAKNHRAPSIFDEVIDRKNTNSIKWDYANKLLSADEAIADPLPMWVADTDFRAPQAVISALTEAVQHGVFGYAGGPTKAYTKAITQWQGNRFGWDVSPDWLMQTSGIITALKNVVQAFSAPGDSVLIQPPVYAHFNDDTLLNGRHLATAPLIFTGDGYRFDEAVFEAAIQANTKLFILSNPHNPTGNVWTEAELRVMGDICARHNVMVISDEIHQDLIINVQSRHIPFASVSESFAKNSITCTAPSKTFNLPGLQCANLFIPNRQIREELMRQYERNQMPLCNIMGTVAAQAAYTHGEAWLEEKLTYVRRNHLQFAEGIHASSKLKVLPTDALYLAWMDCRALGMEAEALNKFMLTKARVWLDKGQKFGLQGHGFMRVNLGCSRFTVDKAIARITTAVAAL